MKRRDLIKGLAALPALGLANAPSIFKTERPAPKGGSALTQAARILLQSEIDDCLDYYVDELADYEHEINMLTDDEERTRWANGSPYWEDPVNVKNELALCRTRVKEIHAVQAMMNDMGKDAFYEMATEKLLPGYETELMNLIYDQGTLIDYVSDQLETLAC